jgi:hypothetical protein
MKSMNKEEIVCEILRLQLIITQKYIRDNTYRPSNNVDDIFYNERNRVEYLREELKKC